MQYTKNPEEEHYEAKRDQTKGKESDETTLWPTDCHLFIIGPFGR